MAFTHRSRDVTLLFVVDYQSVESKNQNLMHCEGFVLILAFFATMYYCIGSCMLIRQTIQSLKMEFDLVK